MDGIKTVEVHGGEVDEWVMEYRPSVLRSLRISEEDISDAFYKSGKVSSIGWIEQSNGLRQSITSTPSWYNTDFKNIPVLEREGRLIRLADVVTIRKSERPPSSYYRVNGKNAVQLVLTAAAGENQLNVATKVRQLLTEIKPKLPPGYGMRIEFDATDYIYENLSLLALQVGYALVVIIMLTIVFFFRWEATFVILSSMVANFLLAAVLAAVFEIEMRLFSLVGSLVLTGLVGGNMVTTYYYYCKHRSRMIIIPLIGSIFIMGAAFSVIWLLPEKARVDLSDFAIVLMITEGLSICICFWLIPAMIEQFGLNNETSAIPSNNGILRCESVYYIVLTVLRRFRRLTGIFWILVFGLPVFLLPVNIEMENRFGRTYNEILGNEWYTENIRPYLDKGTGGLLRLFTNYVYDRSFYASGEQTVLVIGMGMPTHSTIEHMNFDVVPFWFTLLRVSKYYKNFNSHPVFR